MCSRRFHKKETGVVKYLSRKNTAHFLNSSFRFGRAYPSPYLLSLSLSLLPFLLPVLPSFVPLVARVSWDGMWMNMCICSHTVTIKSEEIICFLCALLFSGSHLMLRHSISGWDLQNLRTVAIRCRATPDSSGPVEFLVGNLLRSRTLLFANSSH